MKFCIYLLIVLLSLPVILFAQNPSGMVLKLDGDGDYADFGNNLQANFGTSDFTIEYWINKSTSRLESVLTKRDTCEHNSFWAFRADTAVDIEIDEDLNGTNYLIMASVSPIATTAWHHVAVSRKADSIKIYIDGTFDKAGSTGGTTNISNSASLLIGSGPCIGVDGTMDFTGFIDEVRLWNFARTNSQIQSTMYDTLGSNYYSSADSGLIGYWRFDVLEDLGINSAGVDDIRDFSIFENHGDLAGDAILDTSDLWVGVEEVDSKIPDSYSLHQNYPNPFNPLTTIQYSVPQKTNVTLKVFDILGSEVATLVNEEKTAGAYVVTFNAAGLSSGVYFYSIKAGEFTATKKQFCSNRNLATITKNEMVRNN